MRAIIRPKPFGLSPNVFFLGVVSFLTDISSEMIFTILPLFLFNVLGVGTAIIGLIEGIAESTATLIQVFSGSEERNCLWPVSHCGGDHRLPGEPYRWLLMAVDQPCCSFFPRCCPCRGSCGGPFCLGTIVLSGLG